MHLDQIQSPEDIKNLSDEELKNLAQEIRERLIDTVADRGGHLASNLGIVELTLAIHRVFDMPRDRIIFDVGHQSYVHKLLTGRVRQFHTLRTFGGISGFPKIGESSYDAFETGHASTAISAALGMARARDYLGEDYQVIALVGDGALTGGMCYEAINDAGSSGTRMIIILNDNEMSIAPNVGALSRHLTDIRISKGWSSAKKTVRTGLEKVPLIGHGLYKVLHTVKMIVKHAVIGEDFFETLGFHYFGPIDGYDIPALEKTLKRAKEYDGPVLIHVLTTKGHGYEKAEEQPEHFHGVAPFYVETGDAKERQDLPSFGQVMAEELTVICERNPKITAISAAMVSGTGLSILKARFPERVLDVGIAEEHATTMAAGLAAGGMKPYFAVYASFFQRAYDQVIHDVCMQNWPVTFLLDRAGLSAHDGETHHGVFYLAQLLPVPDMTVLAPRDLNELRQMIRFSEHFEKPLAIAYGRSSILLEDYPCTSFCLGKWETMVEGKDLAILAVGSMVREAIAAAKILLERGISARVVNCSSVKPMDEELLREISGMPVITMEEHVLAGGFGSAVETWYAQEELQVSTLAFGIPDMFVQHGSRGKLLKYLGLLPEQMATRISVFLGSLHGVKRNDG
ncbi:MAG: 1-deoxy-D-xylulose-5-phosphate synthase [Clostridia bacterium]|nr:1-deoxy-D-xylulose-5-phosphate synthase [Clostridia bacterium]